MCSYVFYRERKYHDSICIQNQLLSLSKGSQKLLLIF